MDVEIIHQIRERASKLQKTIVFPEAGDPRVLRAASYLLEENICNIKLLGNKEEIIAANEIEEREIPKNLSGYFIGEPEDKIPLTDHLYERRKQKGISREEAEVMLENPLYLGAVMVATDRADGCVAGSITTTGDVIRAAIHSIGLRKGNKTVSSTFLMALKNQPALTYADCGVVPYPDAEQLADIAMESARTHQLLTQEAPRVAMLSFSTKGSAKHERTELVVNATNIIKQKQPDFLMDGELQFDAAFVPEVAQRKAPDSPIAGNANVLIFPNIDAGNIAYKITERLAGASATGPILQGLAKPMMDLSRGCSWQDIVNAACVAILMGE
ncbi:phosphate acetyltransferase [Aliifodinibius salipaludis]|uniref:Phosphate acetyltransferase n=1 Tax=Fodinibius salipaludis TaxID=2032627 RepID=A0A2A2GAD0_9BACT|nr:phosphate acetyltransferase [Aliifodinibius salipaludis]PAU93807.1 phosphate acetyltransferase [Aliifodinibius salipaludis]